MNSDIFKITLSMLGSILTLTFGVSLIIDVIREWKHMDSWGQGFNFITLSSIIIACVSLICCFFLLKYLFKKLKNFK